MACALLIPFIVKAIEPILPQSAQNFINASEYSLIVAAPHLILGCVLCIIIVLLGFLHPYNIALFFPGKISFGSLQLIAKEAMKSLGFGMIVLGIVFVCHTLLASNFLMPQIQLESVCCEANCDASTLASYPSACCGNNTTNIDCNSSATFIGSHHFIPQNIVGNCSDWLSYNYNILNPFNWGTPNIWQNFMSRLALIVPNSSILLLAIIWVVVVQIVIIILTFAKFPPLMIVSRILYYFLTKPWFIGCVAMWAGYATATSIALTTIEQCCQN